MQKMKLKLFKRNTGFSIVTVILHIALVTAIVIPMARVVVVEEKISQSHDWVNSAYVQARGEVYGHSTPTVLSVDMLSNAVANETADLGNNQAAHASALNYKNNFGQVAGYSLDGFKGYQFDVVTIGQNPDKGSYNKQKMGVVYVATEN